MAAVDFCRRLDLRLCSESLLLIEGRVPGRALCFRVVLRFICFFHERQAKQLDFISSGNENSRGEGRARANERDPIFYGLFMVRCV